MRSFERQETVRTFRERLQTAMDRVDMSKSALAKAVGIDRSTMSQLLSADNDRLPRADTVAGIAATLRVSLDWLMGLTADERSHAAILQESIIFSPATRSPVDENLSRWHQESAGRKIRYVPSTLPDLAKTENTLIHEYQDFASKSTDQAILATRDKRAYSRLPDTDIEVCMSTQGLETFAEGKGIWTGLSLEARLDQLSELQALLRELYPRLRLYLFDGRTHYSAPYTIFGMQRAAIYLGQMYFAFTTREHVRTLTSHFDDLIRAATVQSHEAANFIDVLHDRTRDAA